VSDKYRAQVEALVSFTGTNGQTTFTDVGPDARTVTRVGNLVVDTAQNPFGDTNGSGLFDGTGDYATMPNSSDFSLANTTPFCIECFFMITAIGRSHTLSNKRDATGAEEHSLSIGTTESLSFSLFNTAAVLSIGSGAGAIAINTWYYAAAIRDVANLTRLMLGQPGGMATVQASGTQSGLPASNTGVIHMGRDGFSTTRDLQGRMCWYRFTKGDQRYRTFPYPVPRGAYSLGKRTGVSGKGAAPVTLFA
jgi:hypothetical protein